MIRCLTLLFALTLFQTKLQSQTKQDLTPFVGTWALTLPHNGFNDAGWMEITQEDGYIGASVLWYGGSVTPVDHAYFYENTLILTQSRKRKITEGKEAMVTSWISVSIADGKLKGARIDPKTDGSGVTKSDFTGVRLPADPPRPDLSKVQYGQPIKLLDQNSLKGWKIIGEDRANGWSVSNGVLLNDPVQTHHDQHIRYGNLMTEQKFEDFNLKLEVNIPAENNSGIYLRGIYEIQVFDSYGKETDSHNMGALYSRIKPSQAAEKPAGEWQTLDITLVDRHVNVILNGKTIIDNQPVRGVTGGAMTSNEFKPGPIYLQGDHGKVSYRNIVLTPIKK